MSRCLAAIALCLAACAPPVLQGGSNANDRSNGGDQGETLLTGAMIISPDGHYVVAQRNQTSVLLDVNKKTAKELPEQVGRFVFSQSGAYGIAVLEGGTTVVSYDLATATELWRLALPFESSVGATLAKLSDDDRQLVLGDSDRLFVVDATVGELRGTVS